MFAALEIYPTLKTTYMIKRTKKFEQLLSQLENIKIEFLELVQERQSYQEEKSERWQETEKGEEYTSATDELETAANDLETVYETLNDLFEND